MKLTTDQQNYQRRLLAIDRDLNTYQTQLMSPGPDFEPARRRLLITDEQMAADQAAVRRDGELRCLIIGSADQVSELDAQVAEGEKTVAEAMLTLRNARELLAGISARRRPCNPPRRVTSSP
jgi:hypothetical protein